MGDRREGGADSGPNTGKTRGKLRRHCCTQKKKKEKETKVPRKGLIWGGPQCFEEGETASDGPLRSHALINTEQANNRVKSILHKKRRASHPGREYTCGEMKRKARKHPAERKE